MPVYEWCCPNCHITETVAISVAEYSAQRFEFVCDCLGTPTPMARRYSFAAPPLFEDHWNMAAGKYVRSKRELDDHYKQVNEANNARGRPSNLQAFDRAEVTAADMGVSEVLPERRIDP